MVERHFPEERNRIANELLVMTLGDSAPKKRKRYFLFDGEEPTRFWAATGPDFLRLIDAVADRIHGRDATKDKRALVVLTICDGPSFSGTDRPRLLEERKLTQTFEDLLQRMIDRIARGDRHHRVSGRGAELHDPHAADHLL